MMELHSYAKRKIAKKWTIEQKRKLVEARISNDAMFSSEPRNSVLPWKKILSLSKLDDYNVFFVRKQWSNMVARYKQYKQNRLGNIPSKAIDNEMIQKITQEWEFFQPIHLFMTRKTTNLHSYALKRQAEPLQELEATAAAAVSAAEQQKSQEKQQQQASTSSNERINIFSSDTNDDYAATAAKDIQQQLPTTDHAFYTFPGRGDANGNEQPLSYFADASEDTQESMIVETLHTTLTVQTVQEECIVSTPAKVKAPANPPMHIKQEPIIAAGEPMHIKEELPTPVEQQEQPQQTNGTQAQAHLSEREKYYRHKRRFNRRLERRFDSLLNVFGQIVRAEYPSINVSPLLGDAAAVGSAVVNRLFSSGEEEDEEEQNSSVEEQSMEEAQAQLPSKP